MKNPLTKSTAKLLIQRETGINPTKLEKQDSESPCYKMTSGNLQISLYFGVGDPERKLIIMRIQYLNSGHCTTARFFSDTLEYSDELTQSYHWDNLIETIDGLDINKVSIRHSNEAQRAFRQHCADTK